MSTCSNRRGHEEASLKQTQYLLGEYRTSFNITYTTFILGVEQTTTEEHTRESAYELIYEYATPLGIVLPDKNTYPSTKTQQRNYEFKALAWSLSSDSKSVTMSSLKQWCNKQGMPNTQLIECCKQILTFIMATNNTGKSAYMKSALDVDYTECPKCGELLHISTDVCGTVVGFDKLGDKIICGYKQENAIHHVNREIFGEWMCKSTDGSFGSMLNRCDKASNEIAMKALKRKYAIQQFHSIVKAQKLDNPKDYPVVFHCADSNLPDMNWNTEYPKVKYVAPDKPVSKYKPPKADPNWKDPNNQPLNTPYWVTLRENEYWLGYSEQLYTNVKTILNLKEEK
jgi:hypothetical protein